MPCELPGFVFVIAWGGDGAGLAVFPVREVEIFHGDGADDDVFVFGDVGSGFPPGVLEREAGNSLRDVCVCGSQEGGWRDGLDGVIDTTREEGESERDGGVEVEFHGI